MASEVDICNLALGHLGDVANLQAISPPDGSAQADHCARFYPIARDSLLEMHEWSFAMKRAPLALLATNPTTEWAYAYAAPNNMLNAISVLDPNATDDISVGIWMPNQWTETPLTNGGVYTTQPFILESADAGNDVVYTNQVNAVMRYSQRVTDTGKFSPLFVETLSLLLSSMLAGPVVKGLEGAKLGAGLRIMAIGQDGRSGAFGRAAASDSGQKHTTPFRDKQNVPWINGR